MRKEKIIAFGTVLLLIFIVPSCSEHSLGIFEQPSPWEQYSNKLAKADLTESKAGKLWLEEARKVLLNPPSVEPPLNLEGVFKSKSVEALAWAMELQRGATIRFDVAWEPKDSARLFVDVFRQGRPSDPVHSFDAFDDAAELEVENTGTYILRLQPELLAEGNFSLSITREATYSVFPVEGRNTRAIQSVWGDPRDGGRRRHEGVDIFADRGTPVVSPVRGMVSSVRTGGLGGKTVWVRDRDRGYSLYFAHLDSQVVSFGTTVRPGDTLGFVGNTGNAKYTPPHLHFGVYSGGAFDPYPLLDDSHNEPEEVNISAEATFLQVKSSRANLRNGPSTSFEVVHTLSRDDVVFGQAATHDWYQIITPDKTTGFIHRSLLGEPNPSTVADSTAWVRIDPFVSEDSLRVDLSSFSEIGSYGRHTVLADTNLNVYYWMQ